MSISYSGTFKRSGGIISAISKQLRLVNLKPVKKIEVKFDPFHENAVTARNFLVHINNKSVLETNLNCVIRANVVCDRSEPQITVNLGDEGTIKFLANNLDILEILQLLNKHVSSKVKEDPTSASEPVTKTDLKKRRKR